MTNNLKKLLQIFIVFCGLSFCFAATSYSETYQWAPIKGASYYQGVAQSKTKKFYFRTSANSIKLENVKYVTLHAHKENGIVISTKIEVKRVAQPTQPETPETPKTSKEPEISEEPLSADEIAIIELEKENLSAFTGSPYREISLELSVGQENLSATGGISQFSGKSNIGGTSIRLEVDFAKEQENPWALVLYGRGHNFTTNVDNGAASATIEESQLTLFHFDGFGQFRFYQAPQLSFKIAAGISYIEIPSMQLKSNVSGEAILAVDSFSGASIALISSWSYNPNSSLHLHLTSMVASFGEDKPVNSMNAELKWKTLVASQLHAIIGLHQQVDSYEKALDCPSSISNCYNGAKSKSQQSTLQLGAQMSF